jgi:hypothetical protein
MPKHSSVMQWRVCLVVGRVNACARRKQFLDSYTVTVMHAVEQAPIPAS